MQLAYNLGLDSDLSSVEFPTFRKFFVSAKDHFVPHSRNNYHPHILSHRMLALLSLLLVTVKVVGISLVIMSPAQPVAASEINSVNVISLTNSARAGAGLGVLTHNSLLARAAQNKANDMLARQYFSHNTPDGKNPWSFIKAAGYSYVTAGENLAIDFSEAESVQTAWMNSPGHKANILNGAFKEIGIGIAKGVYDGHQTTIVVQMFGAQPATNVTPQQSPTPVQPQAPAAAQQPAAAPSQPATQPIEQINYQTPAPQLQLAKPPASEQVPAAEPLSISSAEVSLQDKDLVITAKASSSAVQIIALYGSQGALLNPVGDNTWTVKIPVSKVAAADTLALQAYDIAGKMHQQPVANFAETYASAVKPVGEVEGASIEIFGNKIDASALEDKIFLLAMAGLLTCLVIAIAVKRHVQHISLVANTSFVVMLAAILFMT